MKTHPPSGSRAGFTFTELLVVVLLVILLVSLLLPRLAAAKLRGHQIHCASNLKQLVEASSRYTSSRDRPLLPEDPRYRGGNWMGTLFDYHRPRVRVCPSAPVRQPSPLPRETNKQGTGDTAWMRWTSDRRTLFFGSYGFNGWLYETRTIRQEQRRLYINSQDAIADASRTPVFADANWVDVWPLATDSPSNDLYLGRPFKLSGNDMGRVTIARHGGLRPEQAPRDLYRGQAMAGAVNIGFFDGHVALVQLEDLWNYDWHRDWKRPSSRPRAEP
jgi:prepilin-type processing-associated H-X9-DG protein